MKPKQEAPTTTILHAYEAQDYPLCLERAVPYLAENPNDAQVWFVCAMSLYHLGDLARAIDYLSRAQEIAPDDESIAINLSEFLRKSGSLKRAALTLAPFLPSKNPDIYFNLARILSQADERAHAIAAYQEVLKISPSDTQAAYNLANLYAKEESYPQAIALYKTCKSLDAYLNLAHTYVMIDDLDSALLLYKQLESCFAPRLKEVGESEEIYHSYNIARADFYFNYANALRYAGKSREAERFYQKSHMIAPRLEYVINYAHLLLSVGVFERGFSYYQERLKLAKEEASNARFFHSSRHIAILPEPAAIRECIKEARVLIFHEQGFGDTVMFARFIDMLNCKEKYVFVQPQLRRLFATRFCVVEEDFSDFDYCISLPSLPYVLGISLLDDFAHNATYLTRLALESHRESHREAPAEARLDSHAKSHINPPLESSLESKPKSPLDSHTSPLESSAESQADSRAPSGDIDSHSLLASLSDEAQHSRLEDIVGSFMHAPLVAEAKDPPLRIGIFFHSNPNFAYAKYKSIPLATLLECFSSCASRGLDFSLHCIQPEPLESIAKEESSLQVPSTLESLALPRANTQTTAIHTYPLHDFYDTARLIRAMDIVVSVDSVVAHLAIALAVPCATLAYKRYDWRWGEIGRRRFSGYCGGEVFAQHIYGEWGEVLSELESYLLHFR